MRKLPASLHPICIADSPQPLQPFFLQLPKTATFLKTCQNCPRVASETRARLDAAFQARSELESALRALQKGNGPEDVEAVNAAIERAAICGELVEKDIAQAREVLQRRAAVQTAESKLALALRDGTSAAQLSRAIQVCAFNLEFGGGRLDEQCCTFAWCRFRCCAIFDGVRAGRGLRQIWQYSNLAWRKSLRLHSWGQQSRGQGGGRVEVKWGLYYWESRRRKLCNLAFKE